MEQLTQIKLFAKSAKDLKVMAALCQDSIGTLENIRRNKKDKSSLGNDAAVGEVVLEEESDIAIGDDPDGHLTITKCAILDGRLCFVAPRGVSPCTDSAAASGGDVESVSSARRFSAGNGQRTPGACV